MKKRYYKLRTQKEINVAYKHPAVYREGKLELAFSNLYEYDIHPWYACPTEEVFKDVNIEIPFNIEDVEENELPDLNPLSGQMFDCQLHSDYTVINNYTLDEVLERDINFIYPLVIYNNHLFEKYDTIDLDSRVIEATRKGKCKLVFLQVTEGFFGAPIKHYLWLNSLSKNLKISKKNILLITGNLKAPDVYNKLLNDGTISDTYTIVPYSQFNDNLWFSENGVTSFEYNKSILTERFYQNLEKPDRLNKKYHFLCFNRVPKIHRTFIYSELHSNPQLMNKSISSLGGLRVNMENGNPREYYNWMNNLLSDSYKHGKDRILNFYMNHNSCEHIVYDEDDLHNNKASNLNIKAHNQTFVNIVTESLTEPDFIFFSEKTFKPIFLGQPFIIIGNPHSLKKLKEEGFQTFDRWWDESYDEEHETVPRYEKIVDTLIEIASWDLEKCNQVIKEMESVFIHNFEKLIEGNNTYKVMNEVSNFKPNTLI